MNPAKTALNLVKIVQSFEPIYNHGDEDWSFHFKIKGKWQRFHAKKYRETMYVFCSAFDSVEIQENGKLNRELYRDEHDLLVECVKQISGIYKLVKKSPVAYHRALQRSLPPSLRTGVISRKFVNLLIPEFRPFDKELSPAEVKEIVAYLKSPHGDTKIDAITAGTYFEYCRIAYLANASQFKDEPIDTMSGCEMYECWADGRDGGLSKLPLDSPEAFQAWYDDKGRMGDHPWEIYRGGNSTHIDLAVVREYGVWKIKIIAFSSSRLAEACRIALAFHKANLPFDLVHADSYQKRLLAEDYVGILPEEDSLKYGWHRFPKEFDVADFIHYSWFKDDDGRSLLPMAQIKSLIAWFPIRPLFVRPMARE